MRNSEAECLIRHTLISVGGDQSVCTAFRHVCTGWRVGLGRGVVDRALCCDFLWDSNGSNVFNEIALLVDPPVQGAGFNGAQIV